MSATIVAKKTVSFVFILNTFLCCNLQQAIAADMSPVETLSLSIADAIEQSKDCDDMKKNIDNAIVSQEKSIEAVMSLNPPYNGYIKDTDEYQKRLISMSKKAKKCYGKINSPIVDNFNIKFEKKHQKTFKRESQSSCENDCCIKDIIERGAEVSFYSVACLGGSDFACCMAVTLADYDACVNTYCPDNDCCNGVPVSVPPPPCC